MRFISRLAVLFFTLSAMILHAGSKEPVLVVNKGIGGNNTNAALARFERDVLEVKPNYLIIYLGMNDSVNSHAIVPLETYKSNMLKMIDSAIDNGISPVVVTLNPVIEDYVKKRHPQHPAENINEFQKNYDDAIRSIAAEKNIPIVDLRELVAKHSKSLEDKDSLVRNKENSSSADGVHLTAEGYHEFAKLFEPVFKNKIKPGDVVVCFGDSITFGSAMKGAGSAYGETYPAWLSVILNNLAGTSTQKTPPPPPENDKINGSFEVSSDRVHPDSWSLYQIPGKQEGEISFIKNSDDAKDGRNYLHISNKNDKAPAFLLNQNFATVKNDAKIRLVYSAKGSGKLLPSIILYEKNIFKKTIVPDKWQEGGTEWEEGVLETVIPENIKDIRIGFRITGEMDIDSIVLQTVPLEHKAYEGKTHSLSNRYMTVKFLPPELGGGIMSLKNADGYEFLNGRSSNVLWNLALRKVKNSKDYPPIVNLSIDPEQDDTGTGKDNNDGSFLNITPEGTKSCCNIEESKDSITFSWNGIDLENEKGVLDVWVKISLANTDPYARITAGFNNRSTIYTAFYFSAPCLGGIYPADKDVESDCWAVPAFNGRLIKNPIKNGLLGKNSYFQPNRSGHSMQFDAYYNKGDGLYMGTFDGAQNLKRYSIESSPDGLKWSIVHVPDNMKKIPQKWTTPYDTVLRCFNGDWYDACHIYREWALKQNWTSAGPLTTRKSTPEWFKEIDEWMSFGMDKLENDKSGATALLDKLKKYKTGLMAYYWGKGKYFAQMNPERFPLEARDIEYLQTASEYKFPVMGYIQCTDWGSATESFKKHDGFKHSVKNYSGQSLVWPKSKADESPGHGVITFPGETWTQVLGDTVVQMAEAGFSSAYLDSANHGGTYMNFNPLYSNGGGGAGYVKGNQDLIRDLQKRSREINPGFSFTSESFWEGNMEVLDGYLVCNTTNVYLKEKQVIAIPMIHTVYHDYTILFSAWVGRWDLEQEGAKGYIAKFGQIFVWGVKPAWNQVSFLTKYNNHEIALESSLKRYDAYSRSKKFLVYGQMLRSPDFTSKVPDINLEWYRGWSKDFYKVSMPAVLNSAWKAADNSIGLVFYNIDELEHEVTVSLDIKEYGSSKQKAQALYSLNQEFGLETQDGKMIFKCKIPPHSPAVFEISE